MPFHVYVIELDPAVASASARFRKRNPGMEPGARCFYVGQSYHDPDCRYRQHKVCHGKDIRFRCICDARAGLIAENRSNVYVRKYGLYLRRRLFEGLNPFRTRKAAEDAEARLAKSLKAEGHGVWWA
ncbi:MAG: hypothetical protein ABII00_02295 [Elusimicrobiota bacterium]